MQNLHWSTNENRNGFQMNWMNRLSQLVFIAMLFALAGCAPAVSPSPYPNISYPNISTASPTPKAIPTHPISPTPIQLPQIDGTVDSEYCNNPTMAYLPISDAQGLSEDDIAEKLMSLFLDYFNSPQTPGYCKIEEYHIDKVSYGLVGSTFTPKGDFFRVVDFSIKLFQQPSRWSSIGEVDQQYWLHSTFVIIIFKAEADGVYTMRFPDP